MPRKKPGRSCHQCGKRLDYWELHVKTLDGRTCSFCSWSCYAKAVTVTTGVK